MDGVLLRVSGWFKSLCLTALVVTALPSWAQFRVEVTGVGLTQIPIALTSLKGEDPNARVSQIIQADLERSGQFKGVDASTSAVLDENSRVDLPFWRGRNADDVVVGSVTRLADGRFDVRYRLVDAVRGDELLGQSFVVPALDLRLVSHKIADAIYEKLTGVRGIFSTRIAYITKQAGKYNLWVADADGQNAQSALTSPEPIISPAWSPNGRQLAYVSFESRKPVVYVHDVATGKRRLIANFKGSNSAPAWSPDGKQIAVTLTRDGGSQLFVIDAINGGDAKRLMNSSGIDTEPTFSADGQYLYFVSDRGGAPQIYRLPLSGGAPERVTFNGNYNISPSLSPDGRWLAYISRVNGAFKLYVMDLTANVVTALTDTTADERPSFAPNGRLIVYATQTQGREALMTTTLDGKIKARLSGQGGDIREPNWAPFKAP